MGTQCDTFLEEGCVEIRNAGAVTERFSLIVDFADNRDEHPEAISGNSLDFLDLLASSSEVDLDQIDVGLVGGGFTSFDRDGLLMTSDGSHTFVGAEAMEEQPTGGVSVKEEMVVDCCAPYPTSDSFSSSEYYSSEVDGSPFSEVAELQVAELTGYPVPLQCYTPDFTAQCVLMPEVVMKEEAVEAEETNSMESLESENLNFKSTRGRKQMLVTRDAVSTGPKSNGRVRRKPQAPRNSSSDCNDTKASPRKRQMSTRSPKKSASPTKKTPKSSTSSRESSPQKKKMYEMDIDEKMTPQEQHGIIKSKKSRAYRLHINDRIRKLETENSELKIENDEVKRDRDEAFRKILQLQQRYKRQFVAQAREISKLKMQLAAEIN